jgi:hypothetical protein
MPEDVKSCIEDIENQMRYLDQRLEENLLNATARARYTYLETLLKELTKFQN